MAVAFASRFSVLQIEDDLSDSDTKKPAKKGNNQVASAQSKSKKKKKTPVNEAAQLQSLFIGTAKQKGKSNSTSVPNKSAPKPKEEQWEEWKHSDDKFVTESYHNDLEKALLLSKIEQEEGKTVSTSSKENDSEKPNSGDPSKKKKKASAKKEKPATLSLEQFQNLLPSQMEAALTNSAPINREPPQEDRKISLSETDFFDKIGEDVHKIVKSEDRKEAYKRNEPFIADHARSLELRDVLEQKEKLIEDLQTENEELKSDLKAAKQRNRKLCNILAQGEIRDKAEILVQVDQLLQVKDELLKEVSDVSVALEQERSKVHQLQTELKKQGGKKDVKEAKTNS